jgi:hypothetical protein
MTATRLLQGGYSTKEATPPRRLLHQGGYSTLNLSHVIVAVLAIVARMADAPTMSASASAMAARSW